MDEAIAHWSRSYHRPSCDYFSPACKLDTSTPAGKLYEKLIKNDIAVYIAHTNLDVADGGINDWMADMVGIVAEGRTCLEDVHTDKLYKLVVFVPRGIMSKVLEAIWNAGAGRIGNYSSCSFNIQGTGTFLPGKVRTLILANKASWSA